MEMLSIGVYPFFLSNTLSVEMNPAGLEILEGIQEALKIFDLNEKVEITGSTEENVQVTSSGMGLTLLGKASRKDFKLPHTEENDVAVVVGNPECGKEVVDGDESERFSLKVLKRIMGREYIHEIIPAGSGGILSEISQIEHRSDLVFRKWHSEADISKSAGPATSALITLQKENLEHLKRDIGMQVVMIGEFHSGKECEDIWEKSL
ncbi:MAG TPA: selenophosphate synthase [Clostridiaceae bacterium]|nr:selenophosphate synthase [Clostridiaceae bacterium]